MQTTPANNTSQPTAMAAPSSRSGMGPPLFLDQIFETVALFQQFAVSRLHLFAAEVVDVQPLNDAVVAVLAGNRIGINDPLGYPIAAVRRNTHAHPIAGGRPEHPIVHMIQRRSRRGSCGRRTARL